MFAVEPRTLMIFKTAADGRAFQQVFMLLQYLTFRCVDMPELEQIIATEFAGNYVVLRIERCIRRRGQMSACPSQTTAIFQTHNSGRRPGGHSPHNRPQFSKKLFLFLLPKPP